MDTRLFGIIERLTLLQWWNRVKGLFYYLKVFPKYKAITIWLWDICGRPILPTVSFTKPPRNKKKNCKCGYCQRTIQ